MVLDGFFEKYEYWMKFSKMNKDIEVWLIISIVVPIIVSLVAGLLIYLYIPMVNPITIGLALFISIGTLLVGLPYFKASKRIDDIESSLADALKQIADTLKAGDTFESALREISTAEYGALTEEMNNVLRKLEEGENLANSMKVLSTNVDSRLVKRAVTIIVDSINAGAGLSDILGDISDDMRTLYSINRERKSMTMMQTLFMIMAGAVIAPFIFGEVSAIVIVLADSGKVGTLAVYSEQSKVLGATLILVAQIYIIIEVIAASIILSIIRNGNLNKSVLYIPVLLLLAVVIYYVGYIATMGMVSASL